MGEWTDLPPRVATEVFRGLLAHENYDDLSPNEPKNFPLADFRKKFNTIVRNMGVLGYQVVLRRDGSPLVNGGIWRDEDMIFSDPRKFQSPAILRDRGIRVLSVGFSRYCASQHSGGSNYLKTGARAGREKRKKHLPIMSCVPRASITTNAPELSKI